MNTPMLHFLLILTPSEGQTTIKMYKIAGRVAGGR